MHVCILSDTWRGYPAYAWRVGPFRQDAIELDMRMYGSPLTLALWPGRVSTQFILFAKSWALLNHSDQKAYLHNHMIIIYSISIVDISITNFFYSKWHLVFSYMVIALIAYQLHRCHWLTTVTLFFLYKIESPYQLISDSKVHGANVGPTWGRQDPGGPHVGPMNFAIWDVLL